MKKIIFVIAAILICTGLVSCTREIQEDKLSQVIVSRDAFLEDELVIESQHPVEKEPLKEQAATQHINTTENEKTTDEANEEINEEPNVTPEAVTHDFVLNTNSKKFHYPSCSSASRTKDKNKAFHKGTRNELVDMGYSPCARCKP